MFVYFTWNNLVVGNRSRRVWMFFDERFSFVTTLTFIYLFILDLKYDFKLLKIKKRTFFPYRFVDREVSCPKSSRPSPRTSFRHHQSTAEISATRPILNHIIKILIKWSLKFVVFTLHLGHANPDMFSTTPITGTPTFLQNVISFRTSKRLTSCGVVTTTAPLSPASRRYSTIDKCSSDVPGGVSTSKYSSSSQSTSRRNCLIMPFFFGPRQITASSRLGSMNPIDIKLRFSSTNLNKK